jgi:hypothetical protein
MGSKGVLKGSLRRFVGSMGNGMKYWIDDARKQREITFEPKYGPIRPIR